MAFPPKPLVRQILKVWVPVVQAQSQPAIAETPYESSMRVQKEFQTSGNRLDNFLKARNFDVEGSLYDLGSCGPCTIIQ